MSEYTSSLTHQAQMLVNDRIRKLVQAKQHEWNMRAAASDIRKELANDEFAIDPGFVIRRYIQKYYKKYVSADVPDLTSGRNIPWDTTVVDHLIDNLVTIDSSLVKSDWQILLQNRKPGSNSYDMRAMLLKVAFALRMDVDHTIDLMLSCNQSAYSMRDPRDFVCYFHQEIGRFDWNSVNKIVSQFKKSAKPSKNSSGNFTPTPGMTTAFVNQIQIFKEESSKPKRATEKLLTYMLENATEFSDVQDRSLRGFSKNTHDSFMRISKYLRIIYYSRGRSAYPVSLERDGFPNLKELAEAMFLLNGWDRFDSVGQKEDIEIHSSMLRLLNDYGTHMKKIDNFRNGETQDISCFTRNDAILFIFFLLSGFSSDYTGSKSHQEIANQIDNELVVRTPIDSLIQYALNEMWQIRGSTDYQDKFCVIERCFSQLLTSLGYHDIYLPSRLDRLVLLSLLDEQPGKFASEIILEIDDPTTFTYQKLAELSDEEIKERLSGFKSINGKNNETELDDDTVKDLSLACKKSSHARSAKLSEDTLSIPGDLVSKSAKTTDDIRNQVNVFWGTPHSLDEENEDGLWDELEHSPELEGAVEDIEILIWKQARSYPRLNCDEEIKLISQAQCGDVAAKTRVVESYQWLVCQEAHRHMHNGLDFPDLWAAANEGLCDAIACFDPQKAKRLSTLAKRYILRALIEAINRARPYFETEYQWKQVRILRNTTDKLLNQLGREPTTQELCNALDWSEGKVVNITQLSQQPKSIYSPVGDEDDGATLIDFIGNEEEINQEDSSVNDTMATLLKKALSELEKTEIQILKLSYGLFGDEIRHSPAEIAQVFGTTADIIREILNDTVRRLRHNQDLRTIAK